MKKKPATIERGRPGSARRSARRSFTLIELLVAGVITAFVLGSVSMSLSQLGRARNTSKLRFDAHMRADSALNGLRKDIASVLRSDDLFYTRLLLTDDTSKAADEVFDRDEILVFNTRLRPLRDIDFSGEGFEYETQYRIEEDELGPVLWVRHDAMPDEYPAGGGMAMPQVEGVLGLTIRAYDGSAWHDEWDSDLEGLPLAISVTVLACGHRGADDIYQAPRAALRTVISIDRVLSPKDLFKTAAEEEQTTDEMAEDGVGTGAEGLDESAGGEAGEGATDQGGRGRRPGRGGRDRGRGPDRGPQDSGPGPIHVPDGGTVTGTESGQPTYNPGGGGG